MSERLLLRISVEKKGSVRNPSLRIANRDIPLTNGAAEVTAPSGVTYWVYFFIEGSTGSSAQLIITNEAGKELLKIEHKEMEIPHLLGRNGGPFKFTVS